MNKVIILTGNELRHQFFRKYLTNNKGVDVLASYCESSSGNINNIVEAQDDNSLRINHLKLRSRVEKDFFEVYTQEFNDEKVIHIERGEINNEINVNSIIEQKPDILISYGCSIIKSELLNVFRGRFINIHLGLSPYYRGAGTNFWPFVNNELSLIGATFMHIDEGVDTGEIIHQIRAKIFPNDNIHTIGNRLILDSFITSANLIMKYNLVKSNSSTVKKKFIDEKIYRQKDFDENAVRKAYENLNEKINTYLNNKIKIDLQHPIISTNI